MHIAQRDLEVKSTPKLRDVKETSQECNFPCLAIETVHSIGFGSNRALSRYDRISQYITVDTTKRGGDLSMVTKICDLLFALTNNYQNNTHHCSQ